LDEGFLSDGFGLGQSHEVEVGDVSTGAQVGLHDGGSVSDDDGSLGVVDPGLEGLGDNTDWCWGSNNNWCRSWSRDAWKDDVLDLDWSSNPYDWGWCWGSNRS
jgi:hypothetical protein